MKPKATLILLIALLLAFSIVKAPVQAASPVVHAILFYSPSCGHCHKVITEDLPPLMEKYQDQFQIIGVDVSIEAGSQLYQLAVEHYNIPQQRLGVPLLVVGNLTLVGSLEIPEQLPGIIEEGLLTGGIDWPDIPGLKDIIAEQVAEQTVEDPANTETETEVVAPPASEPKIETKELTLAERFTRDLYGNILSVILLVGMVATVAGTGYSMTKAAPQGAERFPYWFIPVVALVGLGVAFYLTYVEVTPAEPVCGPVGDCATVQNSPYARLFDLIPIGALGVVGYLAILGTWLVKEFSSGTAQKYAALAIWVMALGGVLFSIYLTFLEPFVIGATCIWCLTSAAVMTLILIAATGPAKHALKNQ